MKIVRGKKPMPFGDLVMAVYDGTGKRRAKGMVRLAVNGHLVKFQGRRRFVFSASESA